MTKAQAVAEFAATILPSVLAIYGRDATAMRTAWNDYTDSLEKSNLITRRQSETWEQPDFDRLIRKS